MLRAAKMCTLCLGGLDDGRGYNLNMVCQPHSKQTQQVWIPFWRPGQRYRPVFLHVNFQDLAIDAEVLEKDGSEGKLAPFSMLCALKLGLGSSRNQFGTWKLCFAFLPRRP